MNYEKVSPQTINHFYAAYKSLTDSPLSSQFRILVELRTSQMNGCAYCCSLHTKEAHHSNISQGKLDELAAWRTSSRFDSKEKLVLSWCESVTSAKTNKMALRKDLEKYFDEREIVDLTIAISLMNGLNRLAISLRDD